MRCSECGGTGASPCEHCRCGSCRGTGEGACSSCQGQGRQPCPDCEGLGYTTTKLFGVFARKAVCIPCDGMGYKTCTDCGGDGSRECSICSGSGRTQPCPTCDGTCTVPCHDCDGSGARPLVRVVGVALADAGLKVKVKSGSILSFEGLPIELIVVSETSSGGQLALLRRYSSQRSATRLMHANASHDGKAKVLFGSGGSVDAMATCDVSEPLDGHSLKRWLSEFQAELRSFEMQLSLH